MPFSAKSLDFLFENMLNDSRTWFNDHKEDYRRLVTEPFTQLIVDLTDTMLEIDGKFVCNPKKISRIYRDARYARGKSIFRDYVWYSFCRPYEGRKTLPEFYFSISPGGFDYGCGFYAADSDVMDSYRQLILADDKSFKAAFKAYKSQDVFELYGELYKRDRYPEETAEKRDWLNRRSMGVSCDSKDFDLLFGDRLAEKIAADFKAIAPIYKFFLRAAEAVTMKGKNG
ncbi:MAG: DUF2461 domain-containing protein [Ruminococcus sp.]|nr:DUF2461 domain-containing protein [Ruminococcus sp.]MCM1380527.1 DUF2461 domain-containing protein [Muribaculaceae bacterium]MCM1478671.1 DUF2461 domain-containing protein [Muribaculaceae bacterium]